PCPSAAPGRSRAAAPPRSAPCREFPLRDRGDHARVRRIVVEAGEVGQGLAAGLAEEAVVLDRDLLQRLQAVGRTRGRPRRCVPGPPPPARAPWRPWPAAATCRRRSATGRWPSIRGRPGR